MPPEEQLNIDFGTEELNDPNYEQNVEGDNNAPTDGTTIDGASEASTAPDQNAGQQDGTQVGAGGAPDNTGQQQSAASQQSAPANQQGQQQGRLKQDAKGNLVDADGKIVAQAGGERRQYERTQQQQRYIDRLEGEVRQLKDDGARMNVLNGVPERLGLNMQETEMGMQAIASFKRDPVSTARWMLQETMRLGYNLQQIIGADANGQVNGGSLDLGAVKSMISEAMQPLVADREAQQQSTQAEQAALREYEGFVAKHEHATVHEDTLAQMLQRDRSLTPEVAYWQLREWTTKNGFDFSKPLREQVAARQGGQQQPNGNANPQTQTMPMPNGGAMPQADMQQRSNFANADDAWDTIVNQSLAEAGMTR